MDNWFVKLHRKLLDNPIASNPLLIWLFCYLLLLVSHKDHIFYFGKIKIEQKKWEAIISKKDIAKSFWISRWTLDSYLNILESEQVISIKTTTKYTVLTIINWCKYQTSDIKIASTWTSTWHQLEHQPDTINNDKKEKNDKKEIISKDTAIAEYGNQYLNNLESLIKNVCKENNILYSWKWKTERNALKWLLSKKMEDRLKEMNMTLSDLIKTVIPVSSQIKYWKTLSSAKLIYYNREDIYNKAQKEFQTNRSWVSKF